MTQFDDDGDGQISTEEMPEPLRERAMLVHANGGDLSEDELEVSFQRMASGGLD